jgi:hypothetical protein
MADQPDKPIHIPEIPRFEEVLLCAPTGDQPVAFIRTIKWMETVRVFKQNDQGEETDETLGFLVTVPPRNALRIYSHFCRDVKSHIRAVAALEKDKGEKERMRGNLPAVWNGDYQGCPLCAVDLLCKESDDGHQ